MNLTIPPPTAAASLEHMQPKSVVPPDRLQAPVSPALSIAVGIVLFNNSAAEAADLARSLHRAIARLAETNLRANPPGPTVASIRLINNGNRPTDPTPFGPHAVLTNSPVNLGFGRAHNQLMSEAFNGDGEAEFYLALNPDTMLHPDALVEMIAVARRSGGRALVEAAQFPEELPKRFDPFTLDTPWACGFCLLIPAAVYAATDGFDENFFLFCEDVDLSWRARRAGYDVKHAPRALCHHRFNRPGNNPVTRRASLDSARYLAKKWGSEAFLHEMEGALAREGWEPRALPEVAPSPPVPAITDFSHGLSFASERWACVAPVPVHNIVRHTDIDNAIDVVVRFHDPRQVNRLSRCLFSLFGQYHQPIQVLLMLQGLDDTGIAAVDACVDAFDWSAPRRRPIVINVAVPPMGDHRARLWNAGIDAGRARYLGFCDFDDIVHSAGYSYLLHRLLCTGAAAAFASALRVDCTPMSDFDFVSGRQFLPGKDRYDFFVGSFCPPNSVLCDRSRVSPADLYADESLSKNEDYRMLATIAAKYETDWASIGTAVADYVQRTDGSNTVLSHRWDPAGQRDWDRSNESTRQFLATLTTNVPVSDLAHMRRQLNTFEAAAAALKAAVAHERRERARTKESLSWRLTAPVREFERVIRRLRRRLPSRGAKI